MSASWTLERDVSFVALPEGFALAGGALDCGLLAWERVGDEAGACVGVLGGISAGRHVSSHARDARPGFWEALVGPGRAIDTRRASVLGIDWIGGAGESSGPRTSGLGWEFPRVSTHDQARALALLLDELGLARFDRLVGASFGGMVALAFAELFPERVGELVVVSAAHRSDALASAWRSVQAQILELGREPGREPQAVALARALALTTYRGRADWARRGGGPGLAGYLAARGAEFARRFDAPAFALLSRAADEHRVDPARITTPCTLVGATSDLLVPWSSIEELAGALAGPVRCRPLASDFGHDAFLKESARLERLLREAEAWRGGAA